MSKFPIPKNEQKRLNALKAYDLLDTAPDQDVDEMTTLAAALCDVPIALVTLVDENRQWFLSKVGVDTDQTPRDQAFCAHTIVQNEILIIEDAHKDDRFAANELVTGPPYIRFYAGVPLSTPSGENLGSLCVIDTSPKTLNDDQVQALKTLSRQVVKLFELRRMSKQLADTLAELKLLKEVLPVCANCHKIREQDGSWRTPDDYMKRHADVQITHGLCEPCAQKLYPQEFDD